jgi:hypothetical protein
MVGAKRTSIPRKKQSKRGARNKRFTVAQVKLFLGNTAWLAWKRYKKGTENALLRSAFERLRKEYKKERQPVIPDVWQS